MSARCVAARGGLLGRDPQVRQRERRDLLERRAGDGAAVDVALRLVDHHRDEQPRVARPARSRRTRRRTSSWSSRRSRPASPPCRSCRRARSRRSPRRSRCRPGRARPRASCARDAAVCSEMIALALRRPAARAPPTDVDDVRRAQDAAVGDRGVGGAHLHRRDGEALAHRHVRGGRARVLVVGRARSRLLARQVDAGRRAEAEAPHPLVEAPRAEPAADQRRADVGGLREDAGDVARLPAARRASR